MKKNLTLLILIALAVAGLCTAGLYFVLAGRVQTAQPAGPSQTFLVAARKLPRGATLSRADVREVPWQGAELPKAYFRDPSATKGLRVVFELAEGEPLTDSKVFSAATGKGAGLGIPVGQRAVSVRVFDSPGVVNLLQPGHFVDLQYVDPAKSRTFLRKIEVLALQGPREGTNATNAAVLTLLVAPEQADEVSAADAQSKVRILLRNPLEGLEAPASAELTHAPAPQPSLSPQPAPVRTNLMKAAHR
jgi:Flp pilus assembly protein CpaB